MPFGIGDLVKWLLGIMTMALAWMAKGHESRLGQIEARMRVMEMTAVIKTDIRDELKDFRNETNARFESMQLETSERRQEASRNFDVLRVETNNKLEKLSDQITDIGKRITYRTKK